MDELLAKLQKAVWDIEVIADSDGDEHRLLNRIAAICHQLHKAGDLHPRKVTANDGGVEHGT